MPCNQKPRDSQLALITALVMALSVWGCGSGGSQTSPDSATIDSGAIADQGTTDTNACVPTCGDKTCGDDGCGAECGQCAEDSECTEGQCILKIQCPADGPVGPLKGMVVPNVKLLTCDGESFNFHDSCGAKAVWVYGYFGW